MEAPEGAGNLGVPCLKRVLGLRDWVFGGLGFRGGWLLDGGVMVVMMQCSCMYEP